MTEIGETVHVKDDDVDCRWDTKIFQRLEIHGRGYAVISPEGAPLFLVATDDVVKTIDGWVVHEHDLIHGHLIGAP